MAPSCGHQNALYELNKCLGVGVDIVTRFRNNIQENTHLCLSNNLDAERCSNRLGKWRTRTQDLKEIKVIFETLRNLNLDDHPLQCCELLETLARLSFCRDIHRKAIRNLVSGMDLL